MTIYDFPGTNQVILSYVEADGENIIYLWTKSNYLTFGQLFKWTGKYLPGMT